MAGKKQDLIDRLLEHQGTPQSKSGSASSSRATSQSSAAAGASELSLQDQDEFEEDDAAEMDSDWADSGSEGLYAERSVSSLCAIFMLSTRNKILETPCMCSGANSFCTRFITHAGNVTVWPFSAKKNPENRATKIHGHAYAILYHVKNCTCCQYSACVTKKHDSTSTTLAIFSRCDPVALPQNSLNSQTIEIFAIQLKRRLQKSQ